MSADADCAACSCWRDVAALCAAFVGTQILHRKLPLDRPAALDSQHSAVGAARVPTSSLPPGQLPCRLPRCRRARPGAADGDRVELDDAAGTGAGGREWCRCRADCAVLGADASAPDIVSLDRTRARAQPAVVPAKRPLVGPPDQTEIIVRKLDRHPEWRIRAKAYVDLSLDQAGPGGPDVPTRRLRDADGRRPAVTLVRSLGVDRVMLAPALSESQDRSARLRARGPWRSRRSRPKLVGHGGRAAPTSRDGGNAAAHGSAFRDGPLLASSQACARYRGRQPRARGLAPLLAVCAVAIKLDSPGPVLFRQRRVGRHDEPFEVLKFRSMCDGADTQKQEVAPLNVHGGGTETSACSRSRRTRVSLVSVRS